MQLASGTIIADRYRLDRPLGAGGMGEVWAATHTVTRRSSALKFVRARLDEEADTRARFEREARAATAIRHPNVIEVRDYFSLEDGTPVMVMDLLSGESLRARLDRQLRLPVGVACAILAQVSSAISAAHAAGVIHRDLKPDNIFLARDDDGDETVKVLDFGVAKIVGASEVSAHLTEPGAIVGTPWYMAPEQASGDRDVDERVDVWAIGVIAYECLAGRRPVRGDNLGKVLTQLLAGVITPITSVVVDVPEDLATLIDRLLTIDRARRPTDLGEAFETFSRYAVAPPTPHDAGGGATRVSGAGRTERPSDALASTPSAAPSDVATVDGVRVGSAANRPMTHRRSAFLWAFPIAVVVLAAVAIRAWFVAEREHTTTVASASSAPSSPSASTTTSVGPTTAATSVVELPVPVSSIAGASEAFHAGLAALRGGRPAAPSFERALTLDPSMISAHVHILGCGIEGVPLETMRSHFRAASEHRATLSDRDRRVLDAYAPMITKEPPDYREATRRLRAAVELYPGDVQLWDLLGGFGIDGGLEASLAAFEAALARDPHDVQALTNAAERDAYLGRTEIAETLLARCIDDAPTATWCREMLDRVLTSRGACADLETRAREAMLIGPSDPEPTEWLAQALTGRAPIEAVSEALTQSAARMSDAARPARSLEDAVTLAAFRGNFTAAIAGAHKLEALTASSNLARDHGRVAALLMDLLTESGDARQAALVGQAFLARASAWEPPSGGEDFAMAEDATPSILASLRSIGAIDATTFATARDRWVATWDARAAQAVHNFVWVHGYAETSTTPEDATAALAALTKYQPIPPFQPRTIGEAFVGRTYALAGRSDDATVWLERATRSCSALRFPVAQTRAFHWLGLARESKHDAAAACAAYAVVVRRWDKATPRSLTVEAARARRAALRCAD